ncbi:deoxynucleoside triphosphate triphosphohydrolase SAMHD1-like [Neosynchiropus ocellatus]
MNSAVMPYPVWTSHFRAGILPKNVQTSFGVFNDCFYGLVELHPLHIEIIDTPEFQRLRNIKQVAGAHFVYPGATHSRFQHSVGACYLAGKFVRRLKTKQPELEITDGDVLCVEIAALCHHLGHGPFSYLFINEFLPRAWKKESEESEEKRNGENKQTTTAFKHEEVSVKMLDHLLNKNNLKKSMKKYNLNLPGDLNFIKDLILGNKEESQERRDKLFLYDIVNNTVNGIDVDKFDSFPRDCHYLGVKNNADFNRLLLSARVCDAENRTQICYRDKDLPHIYEMFRTRFRLHQKVYQHTVCAVEEMITEALLRADGVIQVKGSNDRIFTLSTAICDMEAYSKLTDHVFEEILYSSDPNLEQARAILLRIFTRDLYKLVGEVVLEGSDCGKSCERELSDLLGEDGVFVVKLVDINYGITDETPFAFYSKDKPGVAFQLRLTGVSPVEPKTFSEKLIRVYTRRVDIMAQARECLEEWRKENGFVEPSKRLPVDDGTRS